MRKLRNKIVKIYARSEIQTPSRSPFPLFNYLFRYSDLRKILIPSFHSQIVNFTTPKTSTPTVIVSASYLNPVPQHNSIATWVEVCDYDNFYYLRKLSLHIRTTYTTFKRNISILCSVIYNRHSLSYYRINYLSRKSRQKTSLKIIKLQSKHTLILLLD